MKTLATITVVLAIAIGLNALPIGEEPFLDVQENHQSHVRVRRFTCDVLGVEIAGFKFNSAACGTHCLTLKKSGGYCNDKGVCICR